MIYDVTFLIYFTVGIYFLNVSFILFFTNWFIIYFYAFNFSILHSYVIYSPLCQIVKSTIVEEHQSAVSASRRGHNTFVADTVKWLSLWVLRVAFLRSIKKLLSRWIQDTGDSSMEFSVTIPYNGVLLPWNRFIYRQHDRNDVSKAAYEKFQTTAGEGGVKREREDIDESLMKSYPGHFFTWESQAKKFSGWPLATDHSAFTRSHRIRAETSLQ